MTNPDPAASSYTAFAGERRIGHGDLSQVARAAHGFAADSPLVFEDATGRIIDLDLRGSADDAVARVSGPTEPPKPARGRPKLGVTAREVTLMPRHWEWLAAQPGGASAALRRLVDQARRESGAADAARRAREAVYRTMIVLAGDRPGFEEAARALFVGDRSRLAAFLRAWPKDIAAYLGEMAAAIWVTPSGTAPPP
jgi:hypothetical protein